MHTTVDTVVQNQVETIEVVKPTVATWISLETNGIAEIIRVTLEVGAKVSSLKLVRKEA